MPSEKRYICVPTAGILKKVMLLCLLGGAAVGALAQGYRARLAGHVTDPNGQAIAATRIVITRLATGEDLVILADADGNFVAGQLQPGKYRITAEKSGFKRSIDREFDLQVDQTARLDITLEVGQITEEVTVDETTALNRENASLGTVVSAKESSDLPLNGRNYLSLAILSPGVIPAAAGANPYNINGARADYVNYLLDGAPNVNRRGNEPVVTPSLEAIQEFKVITNAYSAEYGRLAAGVISVALKSGGNTWHGDLFEFVRNDRFDARSFFDTQKAKLRRNQFGGVLSGPIRKGRTFVLFSYDGLRNRQGQTVVTRVPTAAERAGIFSSTIRNPFTGQAFSSNTITPSLIDPIAQRLVQLFPSANRSGTLNYTTVGDQSEDQNNFIAKLDHRLTSKTFITAEVITNSGSLGNPFRSTALPGYGSARTTRKLSVPATFTCAFSSRIVNEARFVFTRDRFDESSVNAGRNTASTIGINGVAEGYGLTDIVIAGFPELGDATFLPDRWTDREFAVSDTLSLNHGTHDIRIGADVQHSMFSSLFAAFAGGQIAFTGSFSGNPFADFLLGLPVQTQRQVGTNLSHLRSTYYGLFIQDDWRVRQHLTLSLGLRYDRNTPPVEKDDRWANFIIPERRQISAGTAGYPRSMVRSDRGHLAPRVGLAWQPFGRDTTVLRVGYGIFDTFDLQFTQYQIMGATAFPFTRLELYQATAVGNPSLAVPFPNRPAGTPGALSPNGWEFENPTPYVQSWNFTVGQALSHLLTLEISYVGSKGTHLSSTANINQTIRTLTGNVVPFPGFGRILFQRLGANSSYNAMQISLQRLFNNGLGFRGNFTWSKSIDNASFGSPGRLPQNPNDLRAERGLSEFDRRRVWTSDAVYELPIGHDRRFGRDLNGFVEALLGGWQLNGLVQIYDGRPFTPVVSTANTQAGFAARPDLLSSGKVNDPTVTRWFDRTAFAIVPANQFRFGTSGRNILIGPGVVSIDASLFKTFVLPGHEQRLQVRVEVFNVPNHANFGQPDARIDQPTGGAISSAAPGRQVQLAVKYLF